MKNVKRKKRKWLDIYTSDKTSLTKMEDLKIRCEDESIYIKNGKEIIEIKKSTSIAKAYHLN